MRIVDVSTMVGPWGQQKLAFETARELVQKMDHYGIDETYAYSPYALKVNPVDGNKLLAEQLKGFEDRIKPCWVVIPTWDIESRVPLETALKENGVRMVRMMPNEHAYVLDTWVCGELYAMLSRNNIPVLFNNPDVTHGQLHAIANEYPNLKIIITQCEYQQNRILYKLLEKHPNIYLEISTYYIYNGVEDIAKRFGAERMIFGSRMPFQEPGAALGMVMLADISSGEREKILSGNIDALIKEVTA